MLIVSQDKMNMTDKLQFYLEQGDRHNRSKVVQGDRLSGGIIYGMYSDHRTAMKAFNIIVDAYRNDKREEILIEMPIDNE